MELTSDPRVKGVFDNYPKSVKNKMLKLRDLVLTTASEIDGLEKLEETLKWGEPSYLSTKRKKNKNRIKTLYISCAEIS